MYAPNQVPVKFTYGDQSTPHLSSMFSDGCMVDIIGSSHRNIAVRIDDTIHLLILPYSLRGVIREENFVGTYCVTSDPNSNAYLFTKIIR